MKFVHFVAPTVTPLFGALPTCRQVTGVPLFMAVVTHVPARTTCPRCLTALKGR